MTDAGPSATLAGIRERHAVVAAADLNPDAFGGGVYAAVVRLAQEDAPRLAAALEAALEFHGEHRGHCHGCCDAYGEPVEWPCDEFKAITAVLTPAPDVPRT